jgi:hypothetical protein
LDLRIEKGSLEIEKTILEAEVSSLQNDKAGYRFGFVYTEFWDSAHAIACFDTTDNGLIYVEPQTDEIVSVSVGQPYCDYTDAHVSGN